MSVPMHRYLSWRPWAHPLDNDKWYLGYAYPKAQGGGQMGGGGKRGREMEVKYKMQHKMDGHIGCVHTGYT